MGANRSYWRAREDAQRLLDMRSDAAREREYSTLYKRAFDDIQKEIDAFYSRYADAEGISIAAARKRVSQLDIEAYARKAKAYVAEKNFTKKANEEMRLYNLTMKVNRLEMLKAKIALELAAKGSAEERHLKATLDEATRQELERQSGILGETVKHEANPKQIQRIVEGDFHNATFSQRIWNNNKLLQMAIEKELQTVLIQGKRPDYKKLAQLFDASENAAKRLLHTETKRVRTEAAKERYLENGIDDFEYMALGPNPCPICTDLNGKHFPVKKMMSGENAPPMHPNCRCSTAPWVDEAAYNAWLDAKASGEFEGGFDEWTKRQSAKSDELTERRMARLAERQSRQAAYSSPDFDGMSNAELQKWAGNNLKTRFIDFKGVNNSLAAESVKAIAEFERRIGAIEGLDVRFGGLPRGLFAKYDDATNVLILPKTARPDVIAEQQREANLRYKIKWKTDTPYYATESYSGTVWHELGHALDILYGQSPSRRMGNDSVLDKKAGYISGYARSTQNVRVTARSEAWAENFAAYMEGGASARRVPKEIVELIEEYIRKHKHK